MTQFSATHSFWYDERLPFLEARGAQDGRTVCYAPHSHPTFSIGTINAGYSSYVNTSRAEQVAEGTVTVINPEEVHACNPLEGKRWSYRMFYVDVEWLAGLQRENGSPDVDFACYSQIATDDYRIFRSLNKLYDIVADPDVDVFAKEVEVTDCFIGVDALLTWRSAPPVPDNPKVKLAAEYISDNWSSPIALSDICDAANLSAPALLRAFKRHYGTTPYTYLVNRRVQVARDLIRKGSTLVDAGLETGFYDQSHFHKAFKRFTAVTPGQYAHAVTVRRSSVQDRAR